MTRLFTAVLAVCIALLSAFSAVGQTDLDPFYNSSYVAPELNEKSAERLQALFDFYAKENDVSSKKGRKEYEAFVYKSNYFIEKLNRSGSVFYGDTISAYLNSLKDFLLQDHPRRDLIHVYLTRFPAFNAFANDFGNVYINISVLVKLESEEELLAIIAHEISHILLQHTHQFEEFSKAVEDDRWKTSTEFEVFAKHGFSRIQETEADQNGFELLRERGIDLAKASGVFKHLQYDLDPNQSISWDWDLIAGNDLQLEQFLLAAHGGLDKQYRAIEPDTADSLSTHPSIGKRIKQAQEFMAKSTQKGSVQPSTVGGFEDYKAIAKGLLINTYIEHEWYLEGLHEVLQLRQKTPADITLVKAQAKFLTLLCQDGYRVSPFDKFLNGRGSNYSDSTFMAYKELFLSMNSLELNLMALISVRELQQQYKDPYLDRVYGYLICFLYKHNERLFTSKNGQLSFISDKKLSASTVRFNTMDLDYSLDEDDREYFDERLKNGAIYVPVAKLDRTMPLVKHYLRTHPLDEQDRKHILAFKNSRDQYEKTLTADRFTLSLLPVAAVANNFRGKFDRAKDFDMGAKTAFIQSSNVFMKKKHGSFYIDYKESLNLEKRMIDLMVPEATFETNYSNLNLRELSVRDIQRHYTLNIWVNERFQFDDLIYSKVDEQILDIVQEDDLRYVIYNINAASQGPALKAGRHATYSYIIYFDMENQGVAYVSRIASKQRPNDHLFKQLLYLWKRNLGS